MPEANVQSDIVINRPRDVVADYAGNPDNVAHWYVKIQSVEWKTPRPAVLGSQIAFVAQFLGRRLAYTYEIVELLPGERLVMRTAKGPVPDGNDLHIGSGYRIVAPNDAPQPGDAHRFLGSDDSADVVDDS